MRDYTRQSIYKAGEVIVAVIVALAVCFVINLLLE